MWLTRLPPNVVLWIAGRDKAKFMPPVKLIGIQTTAPRYKICSYSAMLMCFETWVIPDGKIKMRGKFFIWMTHTLIIICKNVSVPWLRHACVYCLRSLIILLKFYFQLGTIEACHGTMTKTKWHSLPFSRWCWHHKQWFTWMIGKKSGISATKI